MFALRKVRVFGLVLEHDWSFLLRPVYGPRSSRRGYRELEEKGMGPTKQLTKRTNLDNFQR